MGIIMGQKVEKSASGQAPRMFRQLNYIIVHEMCPYHSVGVVLAQTVKCEVLRITYCVHKVAELYTD